MNDKQIYIAFVMDNDQLLRYAFEYPMVEYWAEHEEQQKLKDYFKKRHYSHSTPLIVEPSELMDFTPYKEV